MKIMVLIAGGTFPWVLKLTIGSLLKHCHNHELEIHVGVNHNYADYHSDLSMFEEIKTVATVHAVKEISWQEHNESMYRYSTMHAEILVNLLRTINLYSFDHAVILDADLHIQGDLVEFLIDRIGQQSMAAAYFRDRNESPVKNMLHEVANSTFPGVGPFYILPKVSIWHLIMSRETVARICQNEWWMYPNFILGNAVSSCYGQKGMHIPHFETGFTNYLHPWPIFADTGSIAGHYLAAEEGLSLFTHAEVDSLVKHWGGMSFNYGFYDQKEYLFKKSTMVRAIYESEFPDGLSKIAKHLTD